MNSPPDFNRLARLYLWMEAATFGPWLWWCRCAWLDQPGSLSMPAQKSRALVLGDGDGRFTARLLRTYPNIQVDAVDASPAMLRSLLERAGPDARRLRVFLADARTFQPPMPPYDLVATHFFLDCLTTAEVQSLAETLRRIATPQARWLVSEFAIPSACRFGNILARPLVRLLSLSPSADSPASPCERHYPTYKIALRPIRLHAPEAKALALRPALQRTLDRKPSSIRTARGASASCVNSACANPNPASHPRVESGVPAPTASEREFVFPFAPAARQRKNEFPSRTTGAYLAAAEYQN